MTASRATIDQARARMILYEEAAKAAAGHVDRRWMRPIEAISKLAEESNALTHIAFLGTAILAKCTASQIDVFSVKVSSGPNGYAARSLCQHVLATNAPELDIHLGVTGREPLNNQPYFRIDRLTRDAPVRSTAQGVLNALCDLLDRLQEASEEEARAALRAFIDVRRRYGTRYSRSVGDDVNVSVPDLIDAIGKLVGTTSEGGKRAQAVVAALMDVFAAPERVDVSRINDPSRDAPADVNIRRRTGDGWERVFEVRDKPVSREDLYHLMSKCQQAGVAEAIMVAIAPSPPISLLEQAQAWGADRGVALSLYSSWAALIREVLVWGEASTLAATAALPGRVEQRLIDLEATPEALELWQRLLQQAQQ